MTLVSDLTSSEPTRICDTTRAISTHPGHPLAVRPPEC
jgi:hypothetical protein